MITVDEILAEFRKFETKYSTEGFTRKEIQDALGLSTYRVNAIINLLYSKGLLEVRMVPKPILIPGVLKPKPVYVLIGKKTRGK